MSLDFHKAVKKYQLNDVFNARIGEIKQNNIKDYLIFHDRYCKTLDLIQNAKSEEDLENINFP